MLEVVVTLFRVYFKLNTLRLCKNLIAAVDRVDFSIFPASSRVSYMFFVGRLSIFDDKYVSTLVFSLFDNTRRHIPPLLPPRVDSMICSTHKAVLISLLTDVLCLEEAIRLDKRQP